MIFLTFYIRQFDLPLRYGVPLPLRRQMDVAMDGTQVVLDLLLGLGVKATFVVNTEFANHAPALVERIEAEGHDVRRSSDDVPRQNYWLSLHNMPLVLFTACKKRSMTLQAWEFSETVYNKELKLPFYIRRNSGLRMVRRLALAIDIFKNRNR